MVLYMIGLGLGGEDDITVKGLKIVRSADLVFLESYLSIFESLQQKERLEEAYGKSIILADRGLIENESDNVLIDQARTQTVALLVVGDQVCSATRTSLWFRCHQSGVVMHNIHNASIMSAAVRSCGLQLDKFGQTISVPFFTDESRPMSFYDNIQYNRNGNLHTLCLLDIKVREPDHEKTEYIPPHFMSIGTACSQLIETQAILQGTAYTIATTLCIALARIGHSSTQQIYAGTLQELCTINMDDPLDSLIICADTLCEHEWNIIRFCFLLPSSIYSSCTTILEYNAFRQENNRSQEQQDGGEVNQEQRQEQDQEKESKEEIDLEASNRKIVDVISKEGMERLIELVQKTQVGRTSKSNDDHIENNTNPPEGVETTSFHIVYNMRDHFGCRIHNCNSNNNDALLPNIQIQLAYQLRNLGYNPRYQATYESPGDRWYSPLQFFYAINGTNYPSDVVAFDDIYIDLSNRLRNDGRPVTNYGHSWIAIYIPIEVWNAFVRLYTNGTGWSITDHICTYDRDQQLVAINASMSTNPTDLPEFDLVRRSSTLNGNPAQLYRYGSVQDIYNNPNQQRIYRCTGFFTMSMNVVSANVDTSTIPRPGETPHGSRVKFTIQNIRAYHEANDVVPIRNDSGGATPSYLFPSPTKSLPSILNISNGIV